jgi:hypothetical protein
VVDEIYTSKRKLKQQETAAAKGTKQNGKSKKKTA